MFRDCQGSVVTWGDSEFGGDSAAVAALLNDRSAVQDQRLVQLLGSQASQLRKGVTYVCGSYGAFAAVKASFASLKART